MVFCLLAAGCSGGSVIHYASQNLLSGNIYETTTGNGQVLRVNAQEVEGWQRYDRNPRKGDGESCALKAEIKF